MIRNLTAWLVVAFGAVTDAEPNQAALDALRPFAPFVGQWKGTGASLTSSGWEESAEVNWGFRKSDGRVSLNFFPEKNPYFTAGLLTYNAESKQYQFIAKTKNDEKLTLTGKREGTQGVRLFREQKSDKWDRLDLKFSRAGDKLILQFARRKGSTAAETFATIEYIRTGKSEEEFAKGPRCVVTGGAGRVDVKHEGETYYVACENSKELLLSNPKKYLAKVATKDSAEKKE